MSFESHKLFDLLPAILRIRDRPHAPVTHGPLASLLAVFAEPIAMLQEDLDQLYDDKFIETCAPWLVPYIGDLIGYRMLHGVAPKVASPRAEVAHTIAYRRRKGTVVVLEQLARDVTDWDANAVEFFQRLIVTQYMNHRRPQCLATPEWRTWEPLYRIGTAFDPIMHTIDVRSIASRRGRHNIPNVGLFLWPLKAHRLRLSPAARVDGQRRRFHPLGIDQQLCTRPKPEDELKRLATPLHVPEPIGRRVLDARFGDYYTGIDEPTKSLRLYDDSTGPMTVVASDKIRVCNLSDSGATWAHLPTDDKYAIDPVLGRIALPATLSDETKVSVDFHYGFSADLGGGEYEREASFETPAVAPPKQEVGPGGHPTIAAAIAALAGPGIVEITDSGRYEETLNITAGSGQRIELRAANGHRPTLVLGGALELAGGQDSEIWLNGLLIAGHPLHVPPGPSNKLKRLRISHCTLVPGLTLASNCTPLSPEQASLVAELPNLKIEIERSILGALRIDPDARVEATDSIIDATDRTLVAYAAIDGASAGAPLELDACTVIGKLHAEKLLLVSNSIVLAETVAGDGWGAPVIAARRQEGCVRFSYLPEESRVPRRYQCLPEAAKGYPELAAPRFTALRYGFPGYAQLSVATGAKLQTGADDEGQPGAFHFLHQPQREANLRVRLDEYLRVGLQAGIFFESRAMTIEQGSGA